MNNVPAPKETFPKEKQKEEWRLDPLQTPSNPPLPPETNGWVFVIKTKAEALEVFKKYVANVERESGKVLKVLRTDSGGEFTSHAFELFCQEKGITHEVTAPYTPQQNALVERRNHTVMNMARCLLKEKNLPQNL